MENNMRNSKGFTLGELLIVVTIIAVLVAISIPVFSNQLEKSREATDLANLRSAYTECYMAVLTETDPGEGFDYSNDNNLLSCSKTVTLKQRRDNWANGATPEIAGIVLGNVIDSTKAVTVTVSKGRDEKVFTQNGISLEIQIDNE